MQQQFVKICPFLRNGILLHAISTSAISFRQLSVFLCLLQVDIISNRESDFLAGFILCPSVPITNRNLLFRLQTIDVGQEGTLEMQTPAFHERSTSDYQRVSPPKFWIRPHGTFAGPQKIIVARPDGHRTYPVSDWMYYLPHCQGSQHGCPSLSHAEVNLPSAGKT